MTLEQAQKLPCFDCIRSDTVQFERYEPELFCVLYNCPCTEVLAKKHNNCDQFDDDWDDFI